MLFGIKWGAYTLLFCITDVLSLGAQNDENSIKRNEEIVQKLIEEAGQLNFSSSEQYDKYINTKIRSQMKYLNYKKFQRKRGLEQASSIHCMVMGSTVSSKISKLGFQNELGWTMMYQASICVPV